MNKHKMDLETAIPNLPVPANIIVSSVMEHLLDLQPNLADGIYITGSIPLNDFHFNKSDIDFLVLCKQLPDEKMAAKLRDIHQEIAKHFKKPNLSGHYLASSSIQINDPENIQVLTYHNGSMRFCKFEMSVVSLFELKNSSITFYGKPSDTLPINTDSDRLNAFLHHNINTYWVKWIGQHASYLNKKIILLTFPWFTEWAVLGVARQLYTLKTGAITSKIDAGYFCLTYLPEEFHSIINRAINIRKDNRTYPLIRYYAVKPSFKRANETIACVRYMIALFNQTYKRTYC